MTTDGTHLGKDDAGLSGLSVRFEEAGILKVEELGRLVLSASPAWATIAFCMRERDASSGEWRAPKLTLRRYKKRGKFFALDRHFTIASTKQLRALATQVLEWFPEVAHDDHDDDIAP